MGREVTKTIEELERQMNRERLERNQKMTTKLEREQQRSRPKRRVLPKILLILALLLVALLLLTWMVLQRTHIVLVGGIQNLPFLNFPDPPILPRREQSPYVRPPVPRRPWYNL